MGRESECVESVSTSDSHNAKVNDINTYMDENMGYYVIPYQVQDTAIENIPFVLHDSDGNTPTKTLATPPTPNCVSLNNIFSRHIDASLLVYSFNKIRLVKFVVAVKIEK